MNSEFPAVESEDEAAEESVQSAAHTRELIMSAITEIQSGMATEERTAAAIGEVVGGINHVADSAQEINEKAINRKKFLFG